MPQLDLSSLLPSPAPVVAQPTDKASNLTVHVSGSVSGNSKTPNANSNASSQTKATMHYAAGIVVGAVIALWLLGAIVFKSVNL